LGDEIYFKDKISEISSRSTKPGRGDEIDMSRELKARLALLQQLAEGLAARREEMEE